MLSFKPLGWPKNGEVSSHRGTPIVRREHFCSSAVLALHRGRKEYVGNGKIRKCEED